MHHNGTPVPPMPTSSSSWPRLLATLAQTTQKKGRDKRGLKGVGTAEKSRYTRLNSGLRTCWASAAEKNFSV